MADQCSVLKVRMRLRTIKVLAGERTLQN